MYLRLLFYHFKDTLLVFALPSFSAEHSAPHTTDFHMMQVSEETKRRWKDEIAEKVSGVPSTLACQQPLLHITTELAVPLCRCERSWNIAPSGIRGLRGLRQLRMRG